MEPCHRGWERWGAEIFSSPFPLPRRESLSCRKTLRLSKGACRGGEVRGQCSIEAACGFRSLLYAPCSALFAGMEKERSSQGFPLVKR
jgi:hypothetical protein